MASTAEAHSIDRSGRLARRRVMHRPFATGGVADDPAAANPRPGPVSRVQWRTAAQADRVGRERRVSAQAGWALLEGRPSPETAEPFAVRRHPPNEGRRGTAYEVCWQTVMKLRPCRSGARQHSQLGMLPYKFPSTFERCVNQA